MKNVAEITHLFEKNIKYFIAYNDSEVKHN